VLAENEFSALNVIAPQLEDARSKTRHAGTAREIRRNRFTTRLGVCQLFTVTFSIPDAVLQARIRFKACTERGRAQWPTAPGGVFASKASDAGVSTERTAAVSETSRRIVRLGQLRGTC